MFSLRHRIAVILIALLAGAGPGRCGAPQAYKWSVQYLIDNSQPVFGRSQEVYPRGNRGLAISPDGNYLYAGYDQSFNQGAELTSKNSRMTNAGEVRKIDLRIPDYEDATKVVLPCKRAKAIAVDDQNRVYLADGKTIDIYDAGLDHVLLTIPTDDCNGVAVAHEGGDTVLYATEREKGEVHRFLIDTRFGGGCKATPAGLAGNGVYAVTGAKSLRGVCVDPKGRIWIADEAADRVFRVNADGTNLVSADVKHPLEIAFYDDTALVTRGTDLQIALVSEDMVVTGNLSVPWEELDLAPYGNNRDGALAGIAVIPGGKGFYVANEHGQTANQKSTYGRTDQNSQVVDGKLYTDAFQDDNEPILRAVPVEMQDASATTATAPGASPPP
jgi:DNA-binding beta-propeller fold protein YncE